MNNSRPHQQGFTLVETLVAISLVTVAIVAPMALVTQSFFTANFSRDEITAYNLAQEGIEAVRAVRDANILKNAYSTGATTTIFAGIPTAGSFIVDARKSPGTAITACASTCPVLQTDGTLYGYETGWTATDFTRTMQVRIVGPTTKFNGNNISQDIVRIVSTVTWHTPGGQLRTFTIYENMYRWICDSAAVDGVSTSCYE